MTEWRPSTNAVVARRRADLLANIRRYFESQDVLGVDTPALTPSAATDPNVESLAVNGRYLHTSPEFHMKRMLADGYPDIYSICRVFRDGESGRRHLPEFTMVEWYRRNFGLDDIIGDAVGLIATVLQRPLLNEGVLRVDYASAFRKVLEVDPGTAKVSALADAAKADDRIRRSLAGRRDAWLDLLFATRIAPAFAKDRLTVVTHFPASQAALARLCPNDNSVADRFEVFCGDLELANGYVELTDADEQLRRMTRDLENRQSLGLSSVPKDEALLAALRSGLPECAGVALGFERLHMLDAGTAQIQNVVSFAE